MSLAGLKQGSFCAPSALAAWGKLRKALVIPGGHSDWQSCSRLPPLFNGVCCGSYRRDLECLTCSRFYFLSTFQLWLPYAAKCNRVAAGCLVFVGQSASAPNADCVPAALIRLNMAKTQQAPFILYRARHTDHLLKPVHHWLPGDYVQCVNVLNNSWSPYLGFLLENRGCFSR